MYEQQVTHPTIALKSLGRNSSTVEEPYYAPKYLF